MYGRIVSNFFEKKSKMLHKYNYTAKEKDYVSHIKYDYTSLFGVCDCFPSSNRQLFLPTRMSYTTTSVFKMKKNSLC